VAGGCHSGDQAQEEEGEEKSSGGGGGGVDRAKGGPATVPMYPWRRSRSRKRRSDGGVGGGDWGTEGSIEPAKEGGTGYGNR
jgi:hypothetical protein